MLGDQSVGLLVSKVRRLCSNHLVLVAQLYAKAFASRRLTLISYRSDGCICFKTEIYNLGHSLVSDIVGYNSVKNDE